MIYQVCFGAILVCVKPTELHTTTPKTRRYEWGGDFGILILRQPAHGVVSLHNQWLTALHLHYSLYLREQLQAECIDYRSERLLMSQIKKQMHCLCFLPSLYAYYETWCK